MNWNIFKIELWTLWRLSWPDLAVRLAATVFFLCVYFVLDGTTWFRELLEHIAPSSERVAQLALLYILLSVLSLGKFRQSGKTGFPFAFNFAGPLSTLWLVMLPLAWLSLSNAALYLILVAIANPLFEISISGLVMLPLVLLATTLMATFAWSGSGRAGRMVGSFATVPVVLLFLIPQPYQPRLVGLAYGDRLGETAFYFYGVVGAATILCAGLCVYLVRLQRCGEKIAPFSRLASILEGIRPNPVRARPFASPTEAQRWFERRQTLRRPFAVVGAGLGILVLVAMVCAKSSGVEIILLSVGCFWAPLALIAGAVEAVSGITYRGSHSRFSIYEASQPITVADALRFKVRAALGIVLIGSLVLVGTGLLVAGVTGELRGIMTDIFGERDRHILLGTAGTFVGLALLSATAVLLAMSMRYEAVRGEKQAEPLSLSFIAFLLLLVGPVILYVMEPFTGRDLELIRHVAFVGAGIGLLGVTTAALRRLLQSGLCRARTLAGIVAGAGAVVVNLLLLALFLGAGDLLATVPIHVGIFTLGVLSLPLACLAWAPLSLAAARHQ